MGLLAMQRVAIANAQLSPSFTDLGMSKVIGHQSLVSHGGAVGSLLWAAPEMFFNSRVTKACDIYSFGVVMWEIITGEVPPRDRQFRPPRYVCAALSVRSVFLSGNTAVVPPGSRTSVLKLLLI